MDLNHDTQFIKTELERRNAIAKVPLKLIVVTPKLSECDDSARSVRVRYPVFTSNLQASFVPTIEDRQNESERPAVAAASRAEAPRLSITPVAGYNRTRQTYGGVDIARLSGAIRFAEKTAISSRSKNGYFDLNGSIGRNRFWNTARIAGTYEYRDTPAGSATLQEGKVTARFSASYKPEPTQSHVIRYGAALEGGHQQAGQPTPETQLPPNSRYGSIKLYGGVTGRAGNNSFAASYGLQLGSTLTKGSPGFKKHVVDLGFSTRLPLLPAEDGGAPFIGPLSTKVHRFLDVDARITAGLIQNFSTTPPAERFFGGNRILPFVSDDSWMIQGNAFIRSLPENRLGTDPNSLEFGGSRFYSVNTTVAWKLWGEPLLPADLATPPSNSSDISFLDALNGQFLSAKTSLANTYRKTDPKLKLTLPEVANLAAALTALQATIDKVPGDVVAGNQNLSDSIDAAGGSIITTSTTIDLITAAPDPQTIEALVNVQLTSLNTSVTELIQNLRDSSQNEAAAKAQTSLDKIVQSGKVIKGILDSVPMSRYVKQAEDTLAPAHRFINVFLHELNIYSIAPVALVDVARVWPGATGTRYGLGGGLRFSLVTANFTVAYAMNANRSDSENAGALFFNLDVTNLFH
jgi:hypothetical protein